MTSVLDTTAIASLEARFRELTNLAPVLVWATQADGTLAFLNDRMARALGLVPGQRAGLDWATVVHSDEIAPFLTAFGASAHSGEPFQIELRMRTASAGYRWFLNQAVPLRESPHGAVTGFIGSSADVTERKLALDTLRAVSDLATELSTTLDQHDAARVFGSFLVRRGLACASLVALGGHDGRFQDAVASHAHGDQDSAADALERRVTHGQLDPLLNHVAAFHGPTPITIKRAGWKHTLSGLALPPNVVGAPLVARGRVVGVVLLFREQRAPNRDDVALLDALAQRAALVVDNSSLYAEAQRRGEELRRTNDALQFLADAGVQLVSLVLDSDVMQGVASLAVPGFADVAVLDALEADGSLTRLGAAGSTPALEALAKRIQPRLELLDDSATRALRAGRSVMISPVRPRHLRIVARGVGSRADLDELAPRSVLFIPMVARHEVLGVITFIRVGDRSPFQKSDLLAVADQLGRRVGLAIENARLYAEAQAREEELRAANVAKDEFLGLISHELRTPITIIAGGAKVLERYAGELDPEEEKGVLADITRESARLAAMLEDLLALARAELNDTPPLEPVLLQRLVSQIIATAGLPRREIRFSADAHLAPVAAEPAYVEHILQNLLSNAHKYSPEAAPIEVRVEPRAGMAAVRVLDGGVGVPPDEANRIFDRFYRSTRTHQMASGAGMGLAVCKRLVETMSGTIWARPRQHGGLEVGFSLPFYGDEEEI